MLIITENIGDIIEFLARRALLESGPQAGSWLTNNKKKLVEEYRQWRASEKFVDRQAPQLVFARGDDWEGVYSNGELLLEGHRIELDDFLHGLELPVATVQVHDEWLGYYGTLPQKLSDVVRENDEWSPPQEEEKEEEHAADDRGQPAGFNPESAEEDRAGA